MVLGLRTIARGLVGGASIAAGAAVLVGVAAVTTVTAAGAVAKGFLKGPEGSRILKSEEQTQAEVVAA